MAELRKNPLTREWVIIAPDSPPADNGDGCPYCPGNEHRCRPELLAYRDPRTAPDAPGWWVRVVAHPASDIQRNHNLARHDEGIYDAMRAVGADEIIIETREHHKAAMAADPQQSEDALWACRERYLGWLGSDFVKSVIVSRDHPAREPAHPHWRLRALPVVPQRLWELAKGMEQYYDYRGRCGMCHIASAEREEGQRIVAENRHFVALTPYASTHPYEMWIVPRRHQISLAQTQRVEMHGLARIMGESLSALNGALGQAGCAMTFICAPCNLGGMEHFHWFLRVLPRVTAAAHADAEGGISVNPVAPEAAARELRRSAAGLVAIKL